MPEIPVYDSPMAERGLQPSDLGAEAYEGMARRVPEYARQVGSAISGVFDVVDQHETQQDANDLANSAPEFEMQMQQKWAEAQAQGVRAEDFFQNVYQPAAEKLAANMRTDRGQKMAQAFINQHSLDFANKAAGEQSALDRDNAVNAMANGNAKYANAARLNPENAAALAKQWAQTAAFQALSANVPQSEVPDLLQKGTSSIYGSAADAWVSGYEHNDNATPAQGDAVREVLSRDEYKTNVSPSQYDTLMNRLDAAQKTRKAQAQQIAQLAFPDVIKRMESNGGVDVGGSGQALIDGYIGSDDAQTAYHKAEMQRQFDAAKAYGTASNGVWQASEPDLQARLATLDSQIGAAPPDQINALLAQRQGLADAWQQRDRAFSSDPAQYVIDRSQTVAAQYQKFQESPSPQTFAAFARVASAEESRLYPGTAPSLVTAEMAGNVSQALSRASDTAGGASAAVGAIQQQAEIAGPYWPQVAHDLFRAKVLNPAQFVAASMFGKPGGVGVAEDLIRAGAMKPADLAKTVPAGMSESTARQAANAALAPLARSLQLSGGGAELTDAYEQALSNLLLLKGTDSPSQAAAYARTMILGDYSFRGALRIPVQAGVNADDVEAGTKAVLNDLPNHNIVAPRSFSGLGPDDQLKSYINSVQRYGTWVTNPDETGAVLLDEQGHPVYEQHGKGAPVPVQLKWRDLAPLGAQARGLLGKAEKFVTGQQ